MRKSILCLVGVVALFAGCGVSQEPIKKEAKYVSVTDMSKNDDNGVCSVYGMRMNGSGLARAEMIKRGLFSSSDLSLVDKGIIRVGMSECGLLAAYGLDGITSYKFVKNKETNEPISKSYIYDCKKSRSKICPKTEVVIKKSHIFEIKKYDAKNF